MPTKITKDDFTKWINIIPNDLKNTGSVSGDSLVKKEEQAYEREAKKREKELKLDRVKTNNDLMKVLVPEIVKITKNWLSFLVFIVLIQGLTFIPFKLTNPVMVTLLGGSTVTVTTFFVIVLRYLFSKQSE